MGLAAMTANSTQQLQQRAQDYVRGRLSEAEREAFELDMVEQPALMDALEVEVALQHGLRHLPAAGQVPHTPQASALRLPLAMAASLLVGIGIGALGLRDTAVDPGLQTATGLYVDHVRGDADPPLSALSPSALILEIPIGHEDPVTVRLRPPDSPPLPALAARPDALGLVRMVLAPAQQKPGRWQAEIESAGHPLDTRSFDLQATNRP